MLASNIIALIHFRLTKNALRRPPAEQHEPSTGHRTAPEIAQVEIWILVHNSLSGLSKIIIREEEKNYFVTAAVVIGQSFSSSLDKLKLHNRQHIHLVAYK